MHQDTFYSVDSPEPTSGADSFRAHEPDLEGRHGDSIGMGLTETEEMREEKEFQKRR